MKNIITIASLILLWVGVEPPKADPAQQVSWETLLEVNMKWENGSYRTQFNDKVKKLDGKRIKIEGYMYPLGMPGGEMDGIILSKDPISGCFYCAPGGVESVVLLRMDSDVKFNFESVTVAGVFKLIADGSFGVIYEMENVKVLN